LRITTILRMADSTGLEPVYSAWLPTFAAGDLPSPEEIDRDGVGKTGSVRISAGRLRYVVPFFKFELQRTEAALD
jgi:hypothetical protein